MPNESTESTKPTTNVLATDQPAAGKPDNPVQETEESHSSTSSELSQAEQVAAEGLLACSVATDQTKEKQATATVASMNIASRPTDQTKNQQTKNQQSNQPRKRKAGASRGRGRGVMASRPQPYKQPRMEIVEIVANPDPDLLVARSTPIPDNMAMARSQLNATLEVLGNDFLVKQDELIEFLEKTYFPRPGVTSYPWIKERVNQMSSGDNIKEVFTYWFTDLVHQGQVQPAELLSVLKDFQDFKRGIPRVSDAQDEMPAVALPVAATASVPAAATVSVLAAGSRSAAIPSLLFSPRANALRSQPGSALAAASRLGTLPLMHPNLGAVSGGGLGSTPALPPMSAWSRGQPPMPALPPLPGSALPLLVVSREQSLMAGPSPATHHFQSPFPGTTLFQNRPAALPEWPLSLGTDEIHRGGNNWAAKRR